MRLEFPDEIQRVRADGERTGAEEDVAVRAEDVVWLVRAVMRLAEGTDVGALRVARRSAAPGGRRRPGTCRKRGG